MTTGAGRVARVGGGARRRTLQPPGWAAPKGYANGVVDEGRIVFIGGQIGWNAAQRFEVADFAGQTRGNVRRRTENRYHLTPFGAPGAPG